jgi:hypothetical protein
MRDDSPLIKILLPVGQTAFSTIDVATARSGNALVAVYKTAPTGRHR